MDIKFLSGAVLTLTAGFLWGTLGPVGKYLMVTMEMDPFTIVLFRACSIALLSGAYLVIWRKECLSINFRQLAFLALIAPLPIIPTYLGYFLSLDYISPSLATVILYSSPLWTVMGASMIEKKKPTLKRIASAFLVIVGVVVATISSDMNLSGGSLLLKGTFLALCAAFGLAGISLVGRYSGKKGFVTQPTLFFYMHLFATLWFAGIKAFFSPGPEILFVSNMQFFWLLYIGILGGAVSYALYFIGLQIIEAPVASVFSSFEVITAIVLSAVILKEYPSVRVMVGAFLVITAIVLISSERSESTVPLEEVA